MTLIKDIMTKSVETLAVYRPLSSLFTLMGKGKISCVVITDHNEIIGVVTERDLIRKILQPGREPKDMTIKDVMSTQIIHIDPNAHLNDAGTLLEKYGIRHLPVVKGGKLKGIVTESDIVRETERIESRNESFSMWQNIQSSIIILSFVFVTLVVLFKLLL